MSKKGVTPLPQSPSRRGGVKGLRELTVTLYRAGRHKARVPFIRMSGRWLEEYGLSAGSRIVVSGEPGRLILTLVAPATPRAGACDREELSASMLATAVPRLEGPRSPRRWSPFERNARASAITNDME